VLDKKQKWFLVAGAASMVASQLAEQAVSQSWRLATRKDPPEDPLYKDVSWKAALGFTAALGAVVAVSEVLGRRAAAAVWRKTTGKRPPQRLRRARH
jgi:hypothetical protein